MSMISEIEYYLQSSEALGALMLSGPWGSGKTHLINECIADNKECVFGVISLFGIGSHEEFNRRVKEMYFSKCIIDNDFYKRAKTVLGTLSKIVSDSTTFNPRANTIAKGVSSMVSFDYLSLVEVKDTVTHMSERGAIEKTFVLVFDDFERCSIPVKDRLGLINEYVENKGIKTIVITDESMIDDPDYTIYKEKVVYRTVTLFQDVDETVNSIIGTYVTNNIEYRKYIIANSMEFIQAFKDSLYGNYRTLKSCLRDFERVFEAWIKQPDVSVSVIKPLIYILCAREYEARAGNYIRMTESGLYDWSDDVGASTKEKYHDKAFGWKFYYLSLWIVDGEWDEEGLIEELKKEYIPENLTPEDKLVNCSIWELEQSDIDNYLPKVLDKAYRGLYSREELISLINTLSDLEYYTINIPCEISFKRIEDGFNNRLVLIKNNEIVEPDNHRFIEDRFINKEAIALNHKIEQIDDKLVAWKNRKQFLDYFSGDSTINDFDLCNQFYEEFDENMRQQFEESYWLSSNSNRWIYARILKKCIFDSDTYSDHINFDNTMSNMASLAESLSLKVLDYEDSIDGCIIKETIGVINQQIERVTKACGAKSTNYN